MIRVSPTNIENGVRFHHEPSLFSPDEGAIPVAETQARSHGVFKSTQFTVAATKTLAETIPGGAIVLTDIVVSAKKKSAATIIIQFNDDSNTEIILSPDIINDTANIVWSPQGLIMGWKDARIEAITDATFDVTIVIGYFKVISGLEYAAWDAFR